MLIDKLKGKTEEPKGKSALSKEQEIDANLATAMGLTAMQTPQIKEAMLGMAQSADPVMAVGQFVAQMILNLKEQSMNNKVPLDDKIWMAEGGVADRIIDDAILDLTTEGVDGLAGTNDAVLEEVINVIKLAGKAGSGGQGPQAAGPPMPQGAVEQGPVMPQMGGMQ